MQPVPVIRHYAEVMEERAEMLAQLADVLSEVGSEHALVGGLAVGHHGRERATIDVDLLVPKRKLGRIRNALESRGYVVRTTDDQVRVYPPASDPDQAEAIADLVVAEANPVLRAAFEAVEPATILGQPIQVVQRGALVALKFHAAMSRTRAHADRLQDVVDIERVITRRFDEEDAALAQRIAAHSYPGAEDDLSRLLADLRAGRPVTI